MVRLTPPPRADGAAGLSAMGSARMNTGSDGGEASDEISLKELILKLQEYPTMKMVFAKIPK
jgi:hypothetical protein